MAARAILIIPGTSSGSEFTRNRRSSIFINVHRKQKRIGLMVEAMSGYGLKILSGITRYVQQHPGWSIAFFNRERTELADLLKTWQGDGIICTLADERLRDAALGRDIPLVNVSGWYVEPTVSNVISNDEGAGRMAADFSLDRGFESFGVVRHADQMLFAKQRLAGFQKRVVEVNREVSELILERDEDLVEWIRNLPRPLALLGVTDWLAISILETCHGLGIKVPEEVSVMGIGDFVQLCDLSFPSLSSIDLDMERRGYEAAALLDRLLQGEEEPYQTIRIEPAHVVERRSTDCYAFSDPDVVAALRFIHENAARTIKVADVVAATDLSRRSLEGRFNRFVSRSLHDEIWRAHFDLAMRLLATSDFSLQEVASRSGFRTASTLVNMFRQRIGITPREYRIANRR